MNWRGLHLSEKAKLSVSHGQLSLEREDENVLLPLDDLAFIILDTQFIQLSASLLATAAEKGCLILSCDKKHMPVGALLPYYTYYRQSETLLAQLALTEPKKKRLWQTIIQQKIHNQAQCLRNMGILEEKIKPIAVLESKVVSGDSQNTEGIAARLYWHEWNTNFVRDQDGDDRENALLNYGYALIRALIARELAAHGFTPSLGLHHRNMGNAFNLADDFIEPWRPFVDYLVSMRIKETKDNNEFSVEDRRYLTRIFYYQITIQGAQMQILDAIKQQIEAFRSSIIGGNIILPLPSFSVKETNDA